MIFRPASVYQGWGESLPPGRHFVAGTPIERGDPATPPESESADGFAVTG